MKVELTEQEQGTILAALRYWQQEGLADHPQRRSDELHEIATCGTRDEVSLDSKGVDALCEKLNVGSP